jgi:type I restriction enzyme, S subunit
MKDCDLLKDVCDFQNGFAFKSKTFKSEGIPLIRISDIQNQQTILDNAVYIQEQDYNKDLSSFKVYNDDILIAMSGGTTGKIGIHNSNQICLLNQRVGLFRPKNNLNKKYLYYFLITKVEENLKIAQGSAQPNLSSEQIKSMLIPRLTLFEQEKIVEKLDTCMEQIDKAIKNVEQNIQNAEDLILSQSHSIFDNIKDFDEKKIDDIAYTTDYVANGSFASLKANVKYFREESYAILIRLLDHSNKFEKDFVYIDKNAYNFLSKSSLVPGDIVVSNIGARLGTTFKVPKIDKKMSLGPNSILVKSDKYQDFLFSWLTSPQGQKKIKKIVSGAGQPKFNKTQFRSLTLKIPKKLSVQKNIISNIEKLNSDISKLKKIYKKELLAINELKQSILEKAFNGEL